jgi:hypothetical protein
MPNNSGGDEIHLSFAHHVVSRLGDVRFWSIVIPTLLLDALVLSFTGPKFASIFTIAIGLTASYLLRDIPHLPPPNRVFMSSAFYEQIVVPVLVGLALVSSNQTLTRIFLMPWYWFKTNKAPSCSFLAAVSAFDWIALIISCVVVATLIDKRSSFAIMLGLTFSTALNLTDIFTGFAAEQSARSLASSCSWAFDQPSSLDLTYFKYGMAVGVVVRGILAMAVAKLIVAWREARRAFAVQLSTRS